MENLKWVTIPRFPKYEINEQLQVRHRIKKKIKSCYMCEEGYLKLNIQGANCEKHKPYLHQLVGSAFIPNPENKPELHHIDEDKLNNHWTNLMWVTRKEHAQLSKENEQYSHKVSVENILYIRWVYTHELKNDLAKKFKLSPTTVYNIAIGEHRPDVGGKFHEPLGIYKKIINIETGKIIPSAEKLSELIGIKKKEIHRQLNGERYCLIPYRYVGQEDKVRFKPIVIKEIKTKLVAKFDSNGSYIETIDLLQLQDKILNQRVGAFLNGNSSSVDGFFYKKVDSNGSFIEPPKFIPVPKKIRTGTIPDAKPIVKYTVDGKELNRYPSMLYVAKELGMDKRDVRNAIRKSPRNYYKGYIWKYA
jgi:hypothetical protein